MSKIKRLINSYNRFIQVPWRTDAASPQRVIFCIYNENDELKLRCKIDEFELSTKQAGHDWALYDLTDTFPDWLSKQRYAKSYFKDPKQLPTPLPRFLDYIETTFIEKFSQQASDENTVVALSGVGSLFGFLKIKEMVDRIAPHVKGRLVIFFPGTYENNNYRLLDGYDGWNYLAVPITADRDF